jgi:hypothetical protein
MEWLVQPYRGAGRWVATALVIFAVAVALALAGCLRFKPQQQRLTRHDHQKHKEFAETECSACHATAEAGANVRPAHKQCGDCHEIDMDKPGDDCLKCHVPPQTLGPKPEPQQLKQALTDIFAKRAAARQARPDATPWDHSRFEGKVPCITCHGDIAAGARKNPHDYHRYNKAPDDCALCHATNRKDVPPRNHSERQGWKLMHGGVSVSGQMPGCKTCHQQNFCDDCHRTEKPRSHNALFRDRGHNFAAAGNRRSCAVCHQSDFCQTCHQQQKPASHTAAFVRFGHCRSCHERSTRETKCQACHTFALSQHPLVTRIQPGRTLHDLPQGYGNNIRNDCAQVCHGPQP